ncbi:MAG: TolC family protein [Sulfurimonas sp.]
MFRILCLILAFVPLWGIGMNELVELGLKQSTAVKQSRARIELADTGYQKSKVQRYGSLDFTGEYTHYNLERTLAPLTPSVIGAGTHVATTKDIFSGGVIYTVPLFTGFAQTREIEFQELSMKMARSKDKLTKEQLAYNIKALYLSVLAQKEALKAQQGYTQALKKLEKKIGYEVKLGKKAPLDLLKAKSDLSASMTKEVLYESTTTTIKAALASLVGIKEITEISAIAIHPEKTGYKVEELLAGSASLAKMKIEELAIRKADKMIAKSASSKLPQVSLTGYAGANYGEDETFHEWDNEALWQVGISVKWNLFDFGKRDLDVQKAKIAKMNAQFQKEQVMLDFKQSLIEGIEQLKQNYQNYIGNATQLELLQKSEKIERVRYDNAAATINDLLLAQGKTQIAQAMLIQSKYEYQKSIYYMQYLMESGAKND